MEKPNVFYVTVRNGNRTGLLLGPYPTKGEADAQVDRGRRLAYAADKWAWFYNYGVAEYKSGVVESTVFDT